jgi:hypothetical protein
LPAARAMEQCPGIAKQKYPDEDQEPENQHSIPSVFIKGIVIP